MVQGPPETNVTVEPETVQTDGVSELKLTGSPVVAVALTAKGALPKTWFGSAPKDMVWGNGVTEKV
jgi:hypothetical protein